MILTGGDAHFPHPNQRAIKSFLSDAKDAKTIVLNGDMLDCYSLSKFVKEPNKPGIFKEAKMMWKFLHDLRNVTKARIIYNEGNHELRLRTRILEKLPELYGAITIPDLIGLDEFDIEYNESIGGESYCKVGRWIIGHFKPYGKNAVPSLLDRFGTNVVQSHTHRISLKKKTLMDRVITGAEIGCMCSLKPSFALKPNWQPGYAIIEDDIRIVSL